MMVNYFHFALKITVSISSHSSEEEVAMTVEYRCNYIFFYLFQIFRSVNFWIGKGGGKG